MSRKKENYNEDPASAPGTWDSEERRKEKGPGWNIQKTIVVMLSVVIVMIAVMYALIFAGWKGCVPGIGGPEPDREALAAPWDETTENGPGSGETAGGETDGDTTAAGQKATEKDTQDATTSAKEEHTDKENGTGGQDKPTKEDSETDSDVQNPGGQQGSQGSSGQQGSQGSSGQQGSQGSSGQQGSQGSSGQQGSQGSSGQQSSGGQQSKPPVPTSQKGTYKADVTVVNSWEENGKKCYQLSGKVSNTSSVDITSWKIEKELAAGSAIVNSWNCTCSMSGNKLVIKPADYNGKVGAGSSANDIGVIVSTTSTLTAFSYSGTTTEVASSGGSGGSGGSSGGNQSQPQTPVTPYVPPVLESGTPVGNHGALSLKGTDLVDKNGKKYQLKGVSTHGLQWFPQYVNKEAIKTLRDNWGANVFRLAMYTHEGGYCNGGNKSELEALVCKGVEACTELGMYVIIDWHVLNERDPNVYKADAKVFFDRMSKKYKDNVNVIYEICNEPNGPGWADVKRYADEIISVIRKNDPDAIIIVGTPTWSQDVDQVAANPVAKPKNVMYALHFYAATHKDDLRGKLKRAYEAGTPIFVSEFSICDASGNGGIDYASAKAWKDLINSYNLSYASWSLCNKAETSALLSSSTNKTSGWGDGDLSEAGRWIRDFIAGK